MSNRFMPMGKTGKWTADVVLDLYLWFFYIFYFFKKKNPLVYLLRSSSLFKQRF